MTHASGTDTVTRNQNVDAGFWIKLGTWDLAPNAGHNVTLSDRTDGVVQADAIRLVSAEGVERIARWQGTVANAGTYQVWARWPAAPTHTFAASYDIVTPSGTQTAIVNQRIEGGRWHLLKTITLAANDNWKVELSDQSPGEVVADAVAITPPLSLTDRFDWSPTLPSVGDYAVYAKWQAADDRATDATYEVTHSGGVATVKADQRHNGGEWRYLGTWSFDPSQSPKVSLLASLNGTVNADAVRFVSGDAIGGDIAYSHGDQLGTIQKLTDASGTMVWDRIARPFGETVSISAASGIEQKLRFPGQYADETGLNYNYFRDYDPTLGRYAESDPIGLNGGGNTYIYVGGNPLAKIDPSGTILWDGRDHRDDLEDLWGFITGFTFPDKVRGQWACNARCYGAPTTCPPQVCPATYGYGVAPSLPAAAAIAKSQAANAAQQGCRGKHCQARCIGPKGERVYFNAP